MFDDTTIIILGNNPSNSKIKEFEGDLQEPQGQRELTIEIEKYKFTISKILYIDYIELLIDLTTYLKINGVIYKVLKVKTFSDYMEVCLYKLRKQVY